jgi:DNA-binding winged helix-turn-helix (wHTH) protein
MTCESSGRGWEVAGFMTRIHFGDFAIDLQTRQLLRAGEQVPLSPKAFALLGYLVEQRPRVVAKRELLDVIWPDVLVEEQNVKNLVNEIRRALSDDPQEPRFIRTAFGVGYAFCGETSEDGLQERRLVVAGYLIGPGSVHQIFTGENLLGRDDDCSVVIEGRGVSRQHARITAASGEVTVEDLGSKNGTWLNDRRIDSVSTLRSGDELRLGTVTMRFRPASDDETSTVAGQAGNR